MLNSVDFPISNTNISEFFLEKEYTDYFTIQQTLHELTDSELIRTESTHSNTHYLITNAGKETLYYFKDKLTTSILQDIQDFFRDKEFIIKDETAVFADYFKTPEQEYGVRCQIKQKQTSLVDLTLTVKTKEQAQAICNNWKDQCNDVYACLMDMLLK